MKTRKYDQQDNREATLQRQLAELQAKFEIEKECKNEAYYFILAGGYLEEFKNFKKCIGGDAHTEALLFLINKLEERLQPQA